MELADVSSVMKWVLLVLLAGFVGQFGKTFAQHLLRNIRKEKEAPAKESPADEKRMIRETSVLTDKKLLKTLAKQKKKEVKRLITPQD
jgi:hypothetical protein